MGVCVKVDEELILLFDEDEGASKIVRFEIRVLHLVRVSFKGAGDILLILDYSTFDVSKEAADFGLGFDEVVE